MSQEYQRLRDAAREGDREIAELEQDHLVCSVAEWADLERRLEELAVKRGSLAKAMRRLRSVSGPECSRRQQEFIRKLPHTYHSHGQTHRRMDYAPSRSHHMPIGSGAVESAIRRVLNLRVKSNSTYWLKDNAETMIRLRAWLKAGRAAKLLQHATDNDFRLAP